MKHFVFPLFCAVCLAAPGWAEGGAGPKLGLQTWTCRNMTFDQVVAFAVKHHIKYLEFIHTQLDARAPKEESLRKKAILDAHGLVAYSFDGLVASAIGVKQRSLYKEENRPLFEFAKLMGIKQIVVGPKDPAEWDNLEQLVKEYDIKLALHNHGAGTLYGNPAAVEKVLAARDHRIGVCLDIGWITAAGFDAAKVFKEYGNRVFDMHMKDKRPEMVRGKTVWVDTDIGQGRADYGRLFAEIKKSGYSGVMAIEGDRRWDPTDGKEFQYDPGPFVDAARVFFREHTDAGPVRMTLDHQ